MKLRSGTCTGFPTDITSSRTTRKRSVERDDDESRAKKPRRADSPATLSGPSLPVSHRELSVPEPRPSERTQMEIFVKTVRVGNRALTSPYFDALHNAVHQNGIKVKLKADVLKDDWILVIEKTKELNYDLEIRECFLDRFLYDGSKFFLELTVHFARNLTDRIMETALPDCGVIIIDFKNAAFRRHFHEFFLGKVKSRVIKAEVIRPERANDYIRRSQKPDHTAQPPSAATHSAAVQKKDMVKLTNHVEVRKGPISASVPKVVPVPQKTAPVPGNSQADWGKFIPRPLAQQSKTLQAPVDALTQQPRPSATVPPSQNSVPPPSTSHISANGVSSVSRPPQQTNPARPPVAPPTQPPRPSAHPPEVPLSARPPPPAPRPPTGAPAPPPPPPRIPPPANPPPPRCPPPPRYHGDFIPPMLGARTANGIHEPRPPMHCAMWFGPPAHHPPPMYYGDGYTPMTSRSEAHWWEGFAPPVPHAHRWNSYPEPNWWDGFSHYPPMHATPWEDVRQRFGAPLPHHNFPETGFQKDLQQSNRRLPASSQIPEPRSDRQPLRPDAAGGLNSAATKASGLANPVSVPVIAESRKQPSTVTSNSEREHHSRVETKKPTEKLATNAPVARNCAVTKCPAVAKQGSDRSVTDIEVVQGRKQRRFLLVPVKDSTLHSPTKKSLWSSWIRNPRDIIPSLMHEKPVCTLFFAPELRSTSIPTFGLEGNTTHRKSHFLLRVSHQELVRNKDAYMIISICNNQSMVPAPEFHPKGLQVSVNDQPARKIINKVKEQPPYPQIPLEMPIAELRHENSLVISWSESLPNCVADYCVHVYLARRRPLPAIVRHVQTNVLSVAKSLAQESARGNADQDIMAGTRTMNLFCPISKKRIVVPVRGVECRHMQCFDAESFLFMNIGPKAKFCCPLCPKTVVPQDLVVDQFVLEVLSFTGNDRVEIVQDSESFTIRECDAAKKTVVDLTKNLAGMSATGEKSDQSVIIIE
ncbi:uncharacterized protein LOC129599798 isoform X2 [Paramacrobiotus metropolitanus]|uniref:uncharacterized protein LOC129599798 isoform X2 n=1 Tax=Paramacrobiotus metropolitanus TaxID=2943436 RepID=UPI002445EB4D|nr:uncharacterized protein LOC129599798 isoform X2 [Paramacrobiotus metropolitanus]